MKKFLSATLFSILSAASLHASQVVVFEGIYRITPLRDSNPARSERVQRCYLVVDVDPGRAASSEVLMSLVSYGAPSGVKRQRLLDFGVTQAQIVEENGVRALALNRLYRGGSVILGYCARFSDVAFGNGMVRLKGDVTKEVRGTYVSPLRLPRLLSGLLSDFTVSDGVFPPSATILDRYQEASVSVSQQATLTGDFQKEGLTVFQAIERLSTLLEGKGYAKAPR